MGIGYLLLYAALAAVALWLIAELLLQNRAPLHWRGVALGGFLGVVAGMKLGSVVVIGAGAALFALGQVFVTLSVKRGHTGGWSLRGADGALPGPLARVPLLGALVGGGAVAGAAAVAVTRVGEVGAVEETRPFRPVADPAPAPVEEPAAVEQTAAFAMQELAADGIYDPGYYEQQVPVQAQQQVDQLPYQDPYAAAYQSGYDPQPQQTGGYDQQQWQQPQPAFAYDQGYGAAAGYQQQDTGYQQPDTGYPQQDTGYPQQTGGGYGGYPQQDGSAGQDGYGYQAQQGWDPNQQQWQPEQQQGIPQQPAYDYGYQQNHTWQQQG
ncbi:hypothetical protein ACWGB8_09530 [Kitasatospora sp. NPDC054939]